MEKDCPLSNFCPTVLPPIFAPQSACPTVLSLPPLSPDDITAALESRLWSERRCLQQQQWQLLLQACLSCPWPLYLEAAYSESRTWTSYLAQDSLSLPASLEGLYLSLLTHLEIQLGKQLVRRAAAVISCSRWGVTEQVGMCKPGLLDTGLKNQHSVIEAIEVMAVNLYRIGFTPQDEFEFE